MEQKLTLVECASELAAVLREAGRASRVALDLEGNGLFAYRSRVCTMQLAWTGEAGVRVAIVDALACEPAKLRELLEAEHPIKVVHDVAFDARLLSQASVALAGVHDTALCASMLGRSSTGLSALLQSELGVHVDKSMQLADWARRPLPPGAIEYLAADVRHLLELDDRLWAEAMDKEIVDEVQTETAHRLKMAREDEGHRGPAFARIRGVDRLDERVLVVLAEVAEAREQLAMARDVPPFRIAPDGVLLQMARQRDAKVAVDERFRMDFAAAIERGVTRGTLEPELAQLVRRPSIDRSAAERRKRREKRLSGWREQEAKRRGVHAQVVLPGHCLRRLAAAVVRSAEDIGKIEGVGTARAARYGAQLAMILAEEADG